MSNPDAMYDEANQLKDQNDLEGAVAKLKEILEIDPDHVLSHSALAIHLTKLGQYEDAVTHAQKVIELQPEDPMSYTQLSVVFQRCGRIAEAEEAMAKSREMQSGH